MISTSKQPEQAQERADFVLTEIKRAENLLLANKGFINKAPEAFNC